MKQRYKVRGSGFLAGTHRDDGEIVHMLPSQATFFLPPYANRLELVVDAPKPVPAPAPVPVARTRSRRSSSK